MNPKNEFSKIYDQYVAKIYRFVYFKVGSKETAEDLASEVFTRTWASYDKIRNPKSEIRNPSAFLYQIARNVVADYYRKQGKTRIISIEDTVIVDPSSIEEQASLKLDIDRILNVLSELSDDYQDLVIWRYIDELSISEISQITGNSEGNVRVGIHRALQALKKRLPLITS